MKGPLGNIMKQAQEMQEQLKSAQEELAHIEVTGVAGGGMVEVIMTCRHDIRRIKIDDSLFSDDKEVLEDLVAALAPRWCEVTTKFNSRGGIGITVRAERDINVF